MAAASTRPEAWRTEIARAGRERPGDESREARSRQARSGWLSRTDPGRLPFVLLFLCISVALLNSFRMDRHLSADGVHYFRTILDGGGFCRVEPGRWFAETLTQWPLVVAVRAGVTDVPVLKAVFAAGLYLPWALAFGLCLRAVRRENPAPLALPILAMACVDLPADAILAGEHHVMVLLASPILLLILRREAPTWGDGLLLLTSLVAFTATYPTAFLPALLFSLLLAGRLRAGPVDPRVATIRGLALLLSLATVAIGVLSSASPRDPANREFFRHSIRVIADDPEILLPAVFSILFLVAMTSRGRAWFALAAVPLVLFVPYSLWAVSSMTALDSFAARTLTVTLLPPLLLLTVVVHARAPNVSRLGLGLLGVAVLAIVAANVRRSTGWSRYRAEMVSVLKTQRGFIPVEATALDHDPFRWGWTSPDLSVVWSWPLVRAIVLNRRAEAWEPFDPQRTLVLKRYVRYDSVFEEADPTARFGPDASPGRPPAGLDTPAQAR